jgi:hypothetical protein
LPTKRVAIIESKTRTIPKIAAVTAQGSHAMTAQFFRKFWNRALCLLTDHDWVFKHRGSTYVLYGCKRCDHLKTSSLRIW